MEHQTMASEVSIPQHHHSDEDFKKRVRKTTILLSVITVIELVIGLGIYFFSKGESGGFLILLFKGIVCILTLAKAYYIVSVFMHLGDEIRNLIMTIIVPLMLFIWFIAAFLWDGNSYRSLRNRYDPYYKQTTLDRETKSADTTNHPLN